MTKERVKYPDGQTAELDIDWEVKSPRTVTLKGGIPLEIVEVASTDNACHMHPQTVEQRAKEGFNALKTEGSYKPRRYPFEAIPERFNEN